jgi:hypothetical protein
MKISAHYQSVDTSVERLVHGSLVWSTADRFLKILDAGWRASAVRKLVSGTDCDRVHTWAGVALVSAVTALVLAPFGTTPRPLAWLVPAVAAVFAIVTLIIARRATSR